MEHVGHAFGTPSERPVIRLRTSLAEVSSWPIELLGVHCLVYEIGAGADLGQMVSAMARDRRVESVQPLYSFATSSAEYNDPYAPLQKNLEQLSVPDAHAVSRGAGVRLAVIDTGVDTTHPDFRPHGGVYGGDRKVDCN